MTPKKYENDAAQSRQHTARTSQPEFAVGPTTVEELVRAGELAARAMNNESLTLAVSQSVENLQKEWLESKPEEKNKREGLYWTYKGLFRFVSELDGMIQEAETIIENRDEKKRMEMQAQEAGIPVDEI